VAVSYARGTPCCRAKREQPKKVEGLLPASPRPGSGFDCLTALTVLYVPYRAGAAAHSTVNWIVRIGTRRPLVRHAALGVAGSQRHAGIEQFKNNSFTENVQRFRGGHICKAHRLLYHSTLGLRVITKKKRRSEQALLLTGALALPTAALSF